MKVCISLALAFFVAVSCFSQVPRYFSYQGYLTTAGGAVHGDVTLTFQLFRVGGAAPIWTSSYSVSVDSGLFSVNLGPFETLDEFENELELVMIKDGSAFPLIRLNSVPYAMRSERADTADFARQASGGLPVGSVIAYAGEISGTAEFELKRSGWTVADGRTLASVFADPDFGPWTQVARDRLTLVLGTLWQGGNNLPNLNGYFLRGAHGTGVDADGNRAVGSIQVDANKSHNHNGGTGVGNPIPYGISNVPGLGSNALNGIGFGSGGDYRTTFDADYPCAAHNHSIAADGAPEARPKNAAVLYLIKVR